MAWLSFPKFCRLAFLSTHVDNIYEKKLDNQKSSGLRFNKLFIPNFLGVFGMAAIPFLCNGIFLNQFSLPRVNLVFTLKLAKLPY